MPLIHRKPIPVLDMPDQLKCSCRCSLFYVMLQDDGNIEVYCANYNHKRTLLNLPELVAHVLGNEDQHNEYNKTEAGDSVGGVEPKTHSGAEAASNNPIGVDGSPTDTDLPDSK